MAAPQRQNDPGAPAGLLDGLPARIVLFDGVCVVCNAAVDWLLVRDTSERLHFAPLQGETAARVRAAFPGVVPDDIDTAVYLDRSGAEPRLWLRSRALLHVLEATGGAPGLWLLRLLPAPLADLGYRLFASVRYRLFGRRDSCRVPSPAERARFLD